MFHFAHDYKARAPPPDYELGKILIMVFAALLPHDFVKMLPNEKQWWTQIALCSIKTLNSHLSTKLMGGDVDEDIGELKLFCIIDVRIIVSHT